MNTLLLFPVFQLLYPGYVGKSEYILMMMMSVRYMINTVGIFRFVGMRKRFSLSNSMYVHIWFSHLFEWLSLESEVDKKSEKALSHMSTGTTSKEAVFMLCWALVIISFWLTLIEETLCKQIILSPVYWRKEGVFNESFGWHNPFYLQFSFTALLHPFREQRNSNIPTSNSREK